MVNNDVVTRVVAGSLGGRRIAVPPRGVRPTAERVREAMFSAIDSRIELAEARVLDLYAGSGALGIEALSRGARYALFVESDRRSAAVLDRNLHELEVDPRRAQVQVTTVERLARQRPEAPFDLLLADPPYAATAATLSRVLDDLADNGWIAAGGLLVVERPAGAAEPRWPYGVEAITTRRYGDTAVCYGRRP